MYTHKNTTSEITFNDRNDAGIAWTWVVVTNALSVDVEDVAEDEER